MNINKIIEDEIKKSKKFNYKKYKLNLESTSKDVFLIEDLYTKKLINESLMIKIISEIFKIDFYDLNVLSCDEKLLDFVSLSYLKEYKIFPISQDEKSVLVGISSIFNYDDAKNLRYHFGKDINIVIVEPSKVENALSFTENKRRKSSAIYDMKQNQTDYQVLDVDNDDDMNLVNAPAVKLADSILKEAVASNASDIHIEPFDDTVKIRYRIDGVLMKNSEIPKKLYPAVLARYKILSNLNIAERRIPQDGKISLAINQIDYDFRVSTIPTVHGEKIAIRIYDNSAQIQGFEYLGLTEEQKSYLKHMITRPHGIVLVTGPTGSGKTTTLYTFLRSLNNEGVNITTVEDPVENQIEGINQIQINPKADLTFNSSLRAILRQDPNVIMIGEIRDEETAQMAVRAAITGHLVLSTLHTNDSIGTITRLVDMGIPRYLVADALIGSIAQRLLRKLCNECKKKRKTKPPEMKRLNIEEPVYIYHPVGCSSCNHTGYRGRTGIFEILNVNSNIKSIIEKNESTTDDLRKLYKEKGLNFLIDEAKIKVLKGVTSMEEYDTLAEINR